MLAHPARASSPRTPATAMSPDVVFKLIAAICAVSSMLFAIGGWVWLLSRKLTRLEVKAERMDELIDSVKTQTASLNVLTQRMVKIESDGEHTAKAVTEMRADVRALLNARASGTP